ncbi:type II toxin-antitoxin system VapC family toxin [bacterium]|nr:type II toxin-antitoxin system VapC family toxin [bacterium]
MGILIDTNILIKAEKGTIVLDSYIEKRKDEDFFISVITASELLHGVWRAEDNAIQARRSAFVEAILSSIPVLSIDLPTARSHAQLWARLQSDGQMIGVHDSWIAASCINYGLLLVTDNTREFERVPGLQIEQWT